MDFQINFVLSSRSLDRSYGYGALSGKMLIARNIENYKIDAYIRAG